MDKPSDRPADEITYVIHEYSDMLFTGSAYLLIFAWSSLGLYLFDKVRISVTAVMYSTYYIMDTMNDTSSYFWIRRIGDPRAACFF